MRGIRCLVAAVLAAGIVTVVAAQPGRQPGNFGGGGQDAFSLVLTNTAIQEDIKVTDDQKKDFKTITEEQTELNKKVSEKYGKEAFAEAKGDKDKFKELIEASGKERAKVRETIRKKTEGKLTDAQKKRLGQINVQIMGLNVFADPDAKMGGGGGGFGGFGFSDSQKAIIKDVGETLKLSDTQKTKIKGMVDEYNKDRDSIRKDIFGDKKGGGFDPEKQKEFRTKTSKLSTETLTKITESLDATQKTAWKGLVGDAFDTSKLFQPPPKKD